MTLKVGAIAITPPVVLAPMAGLTDRPFRALVQDFGAGLVVSEMVASGEFLTGKADVRAKAEVAPGAAGTAVQIAGREAVPMAETARRLAGMGAAIIDINMGCPAKKVTSGASGAALMRDPDHALSLIEAVIGAVEVPVTVKMRLGWDAADLNAAEIGRRAAGAGASMITVHGRTRCQFYKGSADWRAVGQVVRAVPVPVLVNGDVTGPEAARAALGASGAAGVMVGRGAIGAPWRLAQIAAGLAGRPVPARPRGKGLVEVILRHLDAQLAFYGPEIGLRTLRKHLDGYLAHLPESGTLRQRLIREGDARSLAATIRAEVPARDNEHEDLAA